MSGIRAFFKRSKYSLLSNKHSPAQTTQRESIATYHDDHDEEEEDYLRIARWFAQYVSLYFLVAFFLLIFFKCLFHLDILLCDIFRIFR